MPRQTTGEAPDVLQKAWQQSAAMKEVFEAPELCLRRVLGLGFVPKGP